MSSARGKPLLIEHSRRVKNPQQPGPSRQTYPDGFKLEDEPLVRIPLLNPGRQRYEDFMRGLSGGEKLAIKFVRDLGELGFELMPKINRKLEKLSWITGDSGKISDDKLFLALNINEDLSNLFFLFNSVVSRIGEVLRKGGLGLEIHYLAWYYDKGADLDRFNRKNLRAAKLVMLKSGFRPTTMPMFELPSLPGSTRE